MNLLFSKPSMMILESLSFTKTLFAFDFDGTLSQIVRVPDDATIADSTNDLLRTLSLLVPVAIISGRSVENLKQRLKYQPKYLIGNHGLEGLGKRNGTLEEAKRHCNIWKKELEAKAFGAGVELEDKSFSLAIHYRRSRNKSAAKKKIAESLANLSPIPRIVTGKSVFNILPSCAPHKGMAILDLMKQLNVTNAFYIGDDDTDEDVYTLPESRIMTARVGYKRKSAAKYYIDRQSDINKVLRKLISYHLKNK